MAWRAACVWWLVGMHATGCEPKQTAESDGQGLILGSRVNLHAWAPAACVCNQLDSLALTT